MNIIANNPILRITAICLVGVLVIFTSCEKNDNPTNGMDILDEDTQFMLQPPAISVEPFGGNTPATRAAVAMKEERQAFNVGEELGNILTLGNSAAEDTTQTRTLTSGAYCRIVVYKLSEWNAGTLKIFEQRLCKTGQSAYFADAGDVTDPILLDYGDYRIFCYSFNKTTADKLSPLADGTVNVPLTDGDDFLSSDIISLNIAGSQLGTKVELSAVILKHRCCRLIGTLTTVAFTTTGIATTPTPSLSVTGTFTTSSNWSIKNTSFSGGTTSSATKSIPLVAEGDSLTGTLLLLPLSGKSLTTSYTFKPMGAAKNVTASNKSISSSATFNSGGSYSFTIKAVGAYVLTETNPVQIGSYKWAYANLNGSDKKQETYPWVSGKQNGSDNDYWRWNVLNIDTTNGFSPMERTWNSSNDPCRSGLGSSWQVPPATYFDNLGGYKLISKKCYINGITAITNIYGWVSSGTVIGCVFVDTSLRTCIFLPAAGYRTGSSYSDVGNSGNYWTATSLGDYVFDSYYVNFSISSWQIETTSMSGFSLRCVQ